jgi:hypothetical protein
MDVVWHSLKRNDFAAKFSCFLFDQLLEAFLYSCDDYLPPVFGAPHKMIVHKVDSCLGGEIAPWHLDICL